MRRTRPLTGRARLAGGITALAAATAMGVFAVGALASSGQTAKADGDVKTSIVLHLRVPAVEVYGYGAEAAGKDLGTDVDVVGPQQYNNLEQQRIAQSEVDASSKGLALLLVGAEAWRRPIAEWQKQGIKVVTAGIQAGQFMGKNTPLLIAPRDVLTGRMLADLTLKNLGKSPKGEIVVGTSIPGLKLLEDRIKGFKQVMKEKAPGVKVSVFTAADDNVKGVTDWQALIQAHSKALAFVGLASTAPAILGKIKKDTGAKWIVTGCELDPRTPPLIKSGVVAGVTSANFWVQGYVATRILYEQIANNRYNNIHGWLDSGTSIITKKNVDAIIRRDKSQDSMHAYFKPQMDKLFSNLTSHLGTYS